MAPLSSMRLRKDDDPMYDPITVVVVGGVNPRAKKPEAEQAEAEKPPAPSSEDTKED